MLYRLESQLWHKKEVVTKKSMDVNWLVALHQVTINAEEMLCSSEGWIVSATAIGGYLKGGGAKDANQRIDI
jgi:hypothetical protein